MSKLPLRLLAFLILGLAGSLLAAVLQCARCGHEYTEGAATCANCNRELPRATTAKAPAAATKTSVTRDIILAEIASLDRAEDADRHAITLLRARNTLALMQLAPDGAARPAEMIRAIADAERGLRETQDECFGCRGSGKRVYTMADLKGNIVKQSSAAGTVGCPVCGGAGKLPAINSAQRITTRMAAARQRYDRAQQSRGWQEFGGIWLPPGVIAGLDLREKTALKVAAASHCATCIGFGSFGCATCSGAAVIKCPNDKCVQGHEVCQICKGKRKLADPSSTRGVERTCTTCAGSGVAACAECSGRAKLACTKCESTGRAACATCKGLGEPPNCAKCDGTGLAPCRTCKGSGEGKGGTICTTCNGAKEAPCSTCNGNGHAKR